jgi:hypothetical protein
MPTSVLTGVLFMFVLSDEPGRIRVLSMIFRGHMSPVSKIDDELIGDEFSWMVVDR